MYRDLNSNVAAFESTRPQVATGGVDGETVDLRGYDSAVIVVSIGAITGTGGDGTVTLEESDDGTAWTDVADADILGSEPTLAANNDYQFGYIGEARYVRAVLDIGTETNIAASAMVVAGHAHRAPTDESGTQPTYTGT